ncbi:4Fe-4S binding protein [uncultured Cloacibacillus sp.]|uniref:4Fe-4S binding protein n=1 Tax=uncultured Cloacibacillus sp. TaxID=889794 RepID=UPI0026DBAB35|nr:4Fe-4S binding protein [uncultured Cloacibacillus sp.]
MNNVYPPIELMSGSHAIALVDCPECIACNPCGTVCKFGAITLKTVADIPKIDYSKCKGCGLCVQICPGLAIFMVHVKGKKADITIPYEFLPFPEIGDAVDVLDSDGALIGTGVVLRTVSREKSIGDTPTVTFEVDKDLATKSRDIRCHG